MKRLVTLIIAGASIGWLIGSASANLGDTYRESCNRWGEGKVTSDGKAVVWMVKDVNPRANFTWTVYEWFVHNRCVSVWAYCGPNGLTDNVIWQELARTSSGASWDEYGRDGLYGKDGVRRSFQSTDGSNLLGLYSYDNSRGEYFIRVATKDWVTRHGYMEDNSDRSVRKAHHGSEEDYPPEDTI